MRPWAMLGITPVVCALGTGMTLASWLSFREP